MGLKFVNKGSVVVDCRAAMRSGRSWTLVNNSSMERFYLSSGCEAVVKLKDTCIEVQQYLDELSRAMKQEKDDRYKIWACFVDIYDAPTLLNMLDASDHVVEWGVKKNDTLSCSNRSIVRIDYKSDRQLLFQDRDKVVFRDEEPATPAHAGDEA